MAKAAQRRTTGSDVADRVELALSKGTLRQWLVFETAEQVAEAKAMLAARKARHVEAMTRALLDKRQAAARAEVAERALATAPRREAPAAEPEPAPAKPTAAKPRKSPGTVEKVEKQARRKAARGGDRPFLAVAAE